ncbi:hypothetical protein DW083_11565 [Parabacteroides sp. AF48-14]|uniref:hypothetical protein n=1 Tax=Parabacteroides sp. AF48-14 TaxID=2292052 RepID=UPI000F0040B0|nr:hypothetical protein DW083_11565 [Parabacteroides sp. AF48-14]
MIILLFFGKTILCRIYISDKGLDPQFGARPVKRVIQKLLNWGGAFFISHADNSR